MSRVLVSICWQSDPRSWQPWRAAHISLWKGSDAFSSSWSVNCTHEKVQTPTQVNGLQVVNGYVTSQSWDHIITIYLLNENRWWKGNVLKTKRTWRLRNTLHFDLNVEKYDETYGSQDKCNQIAENNWPARGAIEEGESVCTALVVPLPTGTGRLHHYTVLTIVRSSVEGTYKQNIKKKVTLCSKQFAWISDVQSRLSSYFAGNISLKAEAWIRNSLSLLNRKIWSLIKIWKQQPISPWTELAKNCDIVPNLQITEYRLLTNQQLIATVKTLEKTVTEWSYYLPFFQLNQDTAELSRHKKLFSVTASVAPVHTLTSGLHTSNTLQLESLFHQIQ
jgi:hypothetical protein